MVFYLIGLGLGDVEDISVKGLNIVSKIILIEHEQYIYRYAVVLKYIWKIIQVCFHMDKI
jgi:diphthamide biosynthesis methyltransferase